MPRNSLIFYFCGVSSLLIFISSFLGMLFSYSASKNYAEVKLERIIEYKCKNCSDTGFIGTTVLTKEKYKVYKRVECEICK